MKIITDKRIPRSLQRSSEAGFTILETAIALVLMSIVGLGAASMFAYANRNTSTEGDRQLAMAVAQQRMEQLRNVDFNDASLAATAGTTATVTRASRQYTIVTTIADSNTVNGAPTTKTITIQVKPTLNGSAANTGNTLFGSVRLVSQRTSLTLGPNRAL